MLLSLQNKSKTFMFIIAIIPIAVSNSPEEWTRAGSDAARIENMTKNGGLRSLEEELMFNNALRMKR